MKPPKRKLLRALTEVEQQIVAESREWGRRRFPKRLQQLAEPVGEVFPPAQRPAASDGDSWPIFISNRA